MSYSVDLRKRVVNYVESGGSKSEAARRFAVSRKTVYNWLALDDLSPKPHPRHTRKVDKLVLKRHVQEFPDAMLSERAQTVWRSHKYHMLPSQADEIQQEKKHQSIKKETISIKESICANTVN